ncbi:GntR family transcriptional regulator [Opitutaceae bacterium TAV4]|nr:GntR family transcriptional regulator [Opitutaceae bacterium TAV4]RRK00091.1 GntR family transcriptional regulator [Opitutaceae bacterium TAV3]
MPATVAITDTHPAPSPRQQVDALLRTWLRTGEYAPGDLIPTTRDIARLCNDISEPTVRRAIKTLIHEGLLHGVQGKGVYVRATPPAG